MEMVNKKCLYKIISESSSKEGIAFKKQFEQEHTEINFRFCSFRCSGYQGYTGKGEYGYCEQYKVRE